MSRQYTRNQQDIRNKIVTAAQIYKNELMGKTFMYVFDGRYIHLLPQLTKERITVLEDFTTQSRNYKFAFMNYTFTLGLCENLDNKGKRKSDVYLPQSFRVEEDSNRKSKREYKVKFILSKKNTEKVYTSLCYSDGSSLAELPESITQNVATNLIDEITNKKQ